MSSFPRNMGSRSPSASPPPPRELNLNASMESQRSYGSCRDDVMFRRAVIENDPRTTLSFTRVEPPNIGLDTFGDDYTAKALNNCKKTVLGPYNIFLKIIGWRRFSPSQEITPPLHYKILNVLWPILLTLLLLCSCVTQIMLCFSRDYINPSRPDVNGTNHIQCRDHIGSLYILMDMLLIFAYLYGVYIFRVKEPEHLSSFAETVFLGIITRRGTYSPKYLIRSLQFLMLLGLGWILYSMLTSVVRVFAHGYFNKVKMEFIPIEDESTLKWVVGVVVVVSILGFIVFDVAYTAVVINYSIQCQLMVYYLQSISTRIIDREWEIEQSIKEVHSAKQFLSKLNSHMSRATGIMMFIFLTSSFNAIYGVEELKKSDYKVNWIATTTLLSVIQWLIWLLLPLIQAARVTRSGTWLLKTALEMRSRPLTYKDTPQLDLDSFVLYCSNAKMKAKLLSIPISPGMVVGGSFVTGFVFFLTFVLSDKSFSWASLL